MADRLAVELRHLEAEGALVDWLWHQYELERSVLERASEPDYGHLAEHEKLAIIGAPPGL